MTKPKTTTLGEAKTEVAVQLSKTKVQVIGNIAKTKQRTITCVFKDVIFCNTRRHTPPLTTDSKEHYQMLTSELI